MSAPDPAAIASDAVRLATAWCAIRSTAENAPAQREMAQVLAGFCAGLGAALDEAALALDPPILHARLGGPGRPVLLYNMYDVMPASPEGWTGDPWRAVVRELPGIGPALVARGAENNKGPLAVMLATVAALHRAGRLPAPVEILVEGEEERASPTLRHWLARTPCPAGPARAALFPSFCSYGGGPPRLYLGFKGIAHGALRCAAGGWGGPRRPAHSSNAPWIANPAWQLAAALASLAEAPTGRLDSVPLPDAARPLVDALAQKFDPAAELAFRAAERFAVPGDARALLERLLCEASLSISGLGPEGGAASIPPEAWARIDLRVPPGLDPAAPIARLRAQLATFPGVTLDIDDAYPGHAFAPDAPGVAAAIDTYRALGAEPQVWPWAIGAAPSYAFAPAAPSFLIFGLGRGGNAHGPDEFATLAGFEQLAASLLMILDRLGDGGSCAS